MLHRRMRGLFWLLAGLASAGCSPAADDSTIRDVPRDDARDADASTCGPGGECEDASLTCCPTGCVDLYEDLFNCGDCDNECALNEECQAGICYTPECFPECDSRQLCCGGECIDPMSDNSNCGSCGRSCGDPLRCLGGVCMCGSGTGAGMCGPSEECCPTGCVDLMTDPENCGECGAGCGGLPCNAGQCTCGSTVCPTGQACCDTEDGLCADLSRDVDHCGNCDTRCDPDRSTGCADGQCMCGAELQCASGTVTYPLCQMSPVMPPHRCCSGECVRVDDYSCGRCGQRCGAGTECAASASWLGYCEFSCEVPE